MSLNNQQILSARLLSTSHSGIKSSIPPKSANSLFVRPGSNDGAWPNKQAWAEAIRPTIKSRISSKLGFEDPVPGPWAEAWGSFINETSLHGLKFLNGYYQGNSRHLFESVFWFSAFVICTIFGIYMSAKVLVKWTRDPMFVAFDTVTTPVWELPFPAVTVCNMDRVHKSKERWKSTILLFKCHHDGTFSG